MIRFQATNEQVTALMANAINASIPMGLGGLHFQPGDIDPKVFESDVESGDVYADYYQGRMVKLGFRREGDDWISHIETPRNDYQSWASKYPTMTDLLASVPGITQ